MGYGYKMDLIVAGRTGLALIGLEKSGNVYLWHKTLHFQKTNVTADSDLAT